MEVAISLQRCEKQILEGKGDGLRGALRIGKALSIISEGNLWVQVGAKSFDQYVSTHHGFSRSTSYNMMAVSKYFGPELLADPSLMTIDPTRLIRLLPLVTESNKLDLLHDAAQIPDAKGFENQLRNKRGKVGTDECDHPDGFKPVEYEVCPHCNLKRKVAGNAP